MKQLLFLFVCLIGLITPAKAQKGGGILGLSKFTMLNNNPDFQFIITSWFTIGRGPRIQGYQLRQSKDTLYIYGFYDFRGALTLTGSKTFDTLNYLNTIADINYFCISTNSYEWCVDSATGYAIETCNDTTWNHFDSTFSIAATGLKESMAEKTIIYPNPAGNALNIQNTDWEQLIIYDLSGRMLMTKEREPGSNKPTDISKLADGSYLLNLYDKDRHLINRYRFLKQAD